MNNKWTRTRHKIIQQLARPIMRIVLGFKFNYHTKTNKLPKGPCLILSNHVTTYDPFFVGFSFRRAIYYVASDDILSKKFIGPLLSWAINPIPKSKSLSDIKAIKTIIKIINEGDPVCLFPEGNRTYDGQLTNNIDGSTAKLCKMIDVPIVLYNIHGGFGGDPRWGRGYRRGKMVGRVKRVLTKEEIVNLSNEELTAIIKKELNVNDVDLNAKFRSFRRAEYLERIFYMCPDCGQKETIRSNRNEVFCTECGYKLKYNENLTFSLINGKTHFNEVQDWYKYQVDKIIDTKLEDISGNYYTDNKVNVFNVFRLKGRNRLIDRGTIYMTKDKLIAKDNYHEIEIDLKNIKAACIVGKHKANFYVDDYIYQLKGDPRFNALKYVHLFYHLRNLSKETTGPNEFLGI